MLFLFWLVSKRNIMQKLTQHRGLFWGYPGASPFPPLICKVLPAGAAQAPANRPSGCLEPRLIHRPVRRLGHSFRPSVHQGVWDTATQNRPVRRLGHPFRPSVHQGVQDTPPYFVTRFLHPSKLRCNHISMVYDARRFPWMPVPAMRQRPSRLPKARWGCQLVVQPSFNKCPGRVLTGAVPSAFLSFF